MRRNIAVLFWLALAGVPIGCATSDGHADFSAMESQDLPPQGATAKCRDGHYSFAREPRATCSHHGGVHQWMREI